jgi:CBS domain-containing protein
MSVGRICTREVEVAASDETVQVAAERMKSHNVGTLVVVDDANCPVGLVTDRDLAMRVVAEGLDPAVVTVETVMSASPESVLEDTPIESAIGIMRRSTHRRLPVVDDKEKLIGLLSLDDILNDLSEEFEEIGELVRKERPRSAAR